MNFTERYSDLVKYANILINKYRKQDISADELVADTYISISESNPDFSEDEFKDVLKKKASRICDDFVVEFSTDNLATDRSYSNRLYIDSSHDKQCKKCHIIKNMTEFRAETRKNKKTITSVCKDCYNKYMKSYLNKNEVIKKKHSERMGLYLKTFKGRLRSQRFYNNNQLQLLIYTQLYLLEKREISSPL